LGAALSQLALLVEQTVIWHDQVRAVTDEKIFSDLHTQAAQLLDLGDERDWIDNNAVANDANFAASENPGRNEMENVSRGAMNNRVSGIVSALAANDEVS